MTFGRANDELIKYLVDWLIMKISCISPEYRPCVFVKFCHSLHSHDKTTPPQLFLCLIVPTKTLRGSPPVWRQSSVG